MTPASPAASLTFATYLAGDLLPLHRGLARAIAERLERPVEIQRIADSRTPTQAQVVTICAPAYVRRADAGILTAVAAPVLADPDLPDAPVYVSDVVVRADDPARTFADLRGRAWAYNERLSWSGYGVVRATLEQQATDPEGFFASAARVGSHRRALRAVASGAADVAVIDRNVLRWCCDADAGLASVIRIAATLGPSPIQPIAVRTDVPEADRAAIAETLRDFADPAVLRSSGVRRIAAVDDRHYDAFRAPGPEGR